MGRAVSLDEREIAEGFPRSVLQLTIGVVRDSVMVERRFRMVELAKMAFCKVSVLC